MLKPKAKPKTKALMVYVDAELLELVKLKAKLGELTLRSIVEWGLTQFITEDENENPNPNDF